MNISGILFDDKKTIAIFGQDIEFINKTSEIMLINLNDILNKENIKDNSLHVSDFKLGKEFILILLSNGDVYTCGANAKNKLEEENNSLNSKIEKGNLVFHKVPLPEAIIQIEAGYDNSIVVTESGKLYGWGSNYMAGEVIITDKFVAQKNQL